MTPKQEQVLVERLEVLDGSRNKGARTRAAVRVQDLAGILEVRVANASRVSSTPTADEFNLLLDDVKMVISALQVVALALQERTA